MSHRSRLCAIIIDSPENLAEQSLQFWSGALGRPGIPRSEPSSPYTSLETPEGSEPDIVVQTIGSPEPRVHLDIETDDVEAEVRRLEQLGARRLRHVEDYLWIMEAPSGHIFCVVPVQSSVWPVGAIEWQG